MKSIRVEDVGPFLIKETMARKCGLRFIAAEIGVGAATLSRITRGLPADVSTLQKIATWKNLSIKIEPEEET